MGRTYKLGKMEASLAVLGQLAAAALCALAALYIGWISFAKWKMKSSLAAGYAAYDQGQLATAETELKSALGWAPDHSGARELLAKIKCDGDDLSAAEEHYGKLKNFDVPEVSAARGVIAWKKAQAAKTAAEVVKGVVEAQAHFKAAASIPAGDVGLGHCELLLARKGGKASGLAAANAIFQNVRKKLEAGGAYAESLTRDAAIDFYMGLGTALAADERTAGIAAAAFSAAHQYNQRWSVPYACRLGAEARRFYRSNDAVALKDILLLHAESQNRLSGRDVTKPEREAWVLFTLSLGGVHGRLGQFDKAEEMLSRASSSADRWQLDAPFVEAVYRADAVLRLEAAMSGEFEATPKMLQAGIDALLRADNKLKSDPAHKDARARILNAAGWMAASAGDARMDRVAINHLKEAQKLLPDDYAVNRNLLVVLKRLKPPPPPKESEAYLEKARAASGENKEDWAKVEQYLGGS